MHPQIRITILWLLAGTLAMTPAIAVMLMAILG